MTTYESFKLTHYTQCLNSSGVDCWTEHQMNSDHTLTFEPHEPGTSSSSYLDQVWVQSSLEQGQMCENSYFIQFLLLYACISLKVS